MHLLVPTVFELVYYCALNEISIYVNIDDNASSFLQIQILNKRNNMVEQKKTPASCLSPVNPKTISCDCEVMKMRVCVYNSLCFENLYS